MVEPEPPKTREARGKVNSGQVLMCANTVRYIDTGIELKCSTSHFFTDLPVVFLWLSLVCLFIFYFELAAAYNLVAVALGLDVLAVL